MLLKFMDTISHIETSLLRKVYMPQVNNAPFMIKNVNFAFFPWRLLGHSKKITDLTVGFIIFNLFFERL